MPANTSKKLLLIGWDSADWKVINELLAEGGMDGIRSLMEGGTYGNLATLEPQLSPMLWTSIASGKMAYHHGVEGFTEVDAPSGKIVPVSAATRKCRVLWEMLGEKGLRSHIVSWFATHGEQEMLGSMVSDKFCTIPGSTEGKTPDQWPAPIPGTFFPESLSETMADLRVSPHEIDEEILLPFLPDARRIDLSRDKRIHPLREHLAQAYSVHSAATHLMETDPDWDFMAVYYRAIDEVSHHFMRYHPPQLPDVSDEDFRIYQHVAKATYRAHDMMLQRLIALAGPETTILLVSDHGFHSDQLRPPYTPNVPAGITIWHRNQGVFLAKGPAIAANQELLGARLLDIAPTVLHHFGQPIGEDMEGRVLTEIFSEKEPVASIPTWECKTSAAPRKNLFRDADETALLDQFVALGYLNAASSNPTEATSETLRENKWNLARAYLYAGKNAEALPLLEDCFFEFPERTDFSQTLARTQFILGLKADAAETLAVCLKYLGDCPGAETLQGELALATGKYQQAIDLLEKATARFPDHIHLHEMLCNAYRDGRNRAGAERAAQRLLALDPTHVTGHVTRARCLLSNGEAEAASEVALTALALQFASPAAHLVLGRAMMEMELYGEAQKALENAQRLSPGNVGPLKALQNLCTLQGNRTQAEFYGNEIDRNRIAQTYQDTVGLPALRAKAVERGVFRLTARTRSRAEIDETPDIPAGTEFVIVSGLPRSGTSLMMQMLAAAGLEAMTDGIRTADESNPEGYLEWEAIRTLPENPSIITQAKGKAVKIISALLPSLPATYRYKIIFMRRPLSQIADSQLAMLTRSGSAPTASHEQLIASQEKHLATILRKMTHQPSIDFVEINYPDLIENPNSIASEIRQFLGSHLPSPEELTRPIKPSLHRQRQSIL